MSILITGLHGYIGNATKNHFVNKHKFSGGVTLLDVRNDDWRNSDFSKYDAVIHCAALVHKNSKKYSLEDYIKINADLTYKLAKKAKDSGITYFMFMSTEGVYGTSGSFYQDIVLDHNSPLQPVEKYEISKKIAEEKLLSLQDKSFKVAVLRPPFVYGKGCPGNYSKLRKIVLSIGIVPKIKNRKSMIYIENLCEFIYQLYTRKLAGIFLPQDLPYRCTTDMCIEIAKCNDKHILVTSIFNLIIKLLSKRIRSIRVAFGSEYYTASASKVGFKYSLIDFKESIRRSEI